MISNLEKKELILRNGSKLASDYLVSGNSSIVSKAFLDTEVSIKQDLVASPTIGDILTVDGRGQSIDSGFRFNDAVTNAYSIWSSEKINNTIDSKLIGAMVIQDVYDPTVTSAYPTSTDTKEGDAIKGGYFWVIGATGTINGIAVNRGDSVIAKVDNPGQTNANWSMLESNIGFTPENVANKLAIFQTTPDDTHYPTEKLVHDSLATKQALITIPTANDIVITNASGQSIDSGYNFNDNGTGTTNILSASKQYSTFAQGSSSSADGQLALFNGTGGKSLKTANITGLLKASSGVLAGAVAKTDYVPATTGSSIQKADSTGGLTGATAYVDYNTIWSSEAIVNFGTATVTIGTVPAGFTISSVYIRCTSTIDDVNATLKIGTSLATSLILGTSEIGLLSQYNTTDGMVQNFPDGTICNADGSDITFVTATAIIATLTATNPTQGQYIVRVQAVKNTP